MFTDLVIWKHSRNQHDSRQHNTQVQLQYKINYPVSYQRLTIVQISLVKTPKEIIEYKLYILRDISLAINFATETEILEASSTMCKYF